MQKSISDYVSYVESQISLFKEYSNLVDLGLNEVTPALINKNLAIFTQVNIALNGEYQRKKAELASIQREYACWWDEKFVSVKNDMSAGKPSSYKVAVKEIEVELRNTYAKDFAEWTEKINAADLNVAFLRRLLDQWKQHSNIIIALSQNMRQEISSLSLGDRMNSTVAMRVRRPID